MMINMKLKNYNRILKYIVLVLIAWVMIYPLLWMIGASFKSNAEIYTSASFFPKDIIMDAFKNGWNVSGQFTFGLFFINTFKLVIPTVFFTVFSSVLVGYGFARFRFPLKKILLTLMISTLMLPDTVVIIPRFILFAKLGWLNSYLPFIMPALVGAYPFFNFMMVQFIRGIPKELDDSAKIDGCSSFRILISILLPLCKPAIFSVIIFQSIWMWNDFFNVLIYINSVRKFPISLGLRMSMDVVTKGDLNQVMAMSVLSVVPLVILFFMAQKYFVEGITTKGLKG